MYDGRQTREPRPSYNVYYDRQTMCMAVAVLLSFRQNTHSFKAYTNKQTLTKQAPTYKEN